MPGFTLNPDGSEQVQYTMEGLPVRAIGSGLSRANGYAAACHWHNDIEMLTVPEGEIDYFVNGKSYHLKQGEGILVNARRLHYGYSADEKDCRYRFIVFHPRLLGDQPAVREAVERFTSDGSADCRLFSASSNEMLLFDEMYRAAGAGDALATVAKCAELIGAAGESAGHDRENAVRTEWVILRKMTGFIQGNYAEKITLDGIAASGAVSRNRCCVLFRENLGISPMEYVNRYRLDKACDMLRRGSTVTEAAFSCGFNGQSYFTELFRRRYGKPPKRYQNDAALCAGFGSPDGGG